MCNASTKLVSAGVHLVVELLTLSKLQCKQVQRLQFLSTVVANVTPEK
jgi:hypothetical protein